jgi:hypothetical protein
VTMTDRVRAFRAAFPTRLASWPTIVEEQGRTVVYATWVIGNDYRNKTRYYGAYPAGYLARVNALFPDSITRLHAFSGSLPAGDYVRCDLLQPAEFQCRVEELPAQLSGPAFDLVYADPPYTAADAAKYRTPMVDRRRALAALAEVTLPGGHLVWLDTVWPMHSKRQWVTVGRIAIVRSTNHRVRMATIFERVA